MRCASDVLFERANWHEKYYNGHPCQLNPSTWIFFTTKIRNQQKVGDELLRKVSFFRPKWVNIGIDHDTVCAGVGGTAIRHSTSYPE